MQSQAEPIAKWSLGKCVAFRFICIYLFVYNIPSFMDYFLWETIVPWFGKYVLHLSNDITILPNGSGDTTYNYVQVLLFVLIAGIGTVLWSVFDRKRSNYCRVHLWLYTFVRINLAMTMIMYGLVKVIPTQFGPLYLHELSMPYGDMSPMGVLWRFMSASDTYTIFTGLVEVIGGILLVIPRLYLIGSILCIGITTNVFMLNMSYDVPVKLLSFHLLLMSLFLVAPDWRRLTDLFFFNRRVESSVAPELFQRKWLNRSFTALTIAYIAWLGEDSFETNYLYRKTHDDFVAEFPLYGVWSVDKFHVDGEVKPPLLTDETRWKDIIFSTPGSLRIQKINGKAELFDLKSDFEKNTLTLVEKGQDPNRESELSFKRDSQNPQQITIEGVLDGRHIHAVLFRKEFVLLNRGFHWINESPFVQ